MTERAIIDGRNAVIEDHGPAGGKKITFDDGQIVFCVPMVPSEPTTKSASTQDVLVVRHGSTALNSEDGAGEDRIRGWKDVPLSDKGRSEVKDTANELKDSGVKTLVHSDLERAKDTAAAIADKTDAKLVPSKGLRPWHVGHFTGESSAKARPELEAMARKTPDKTVPDGESFNDFKSRVFSGVHSAITDHADKGPVGIVTHHRVERLLSAWIANGSKPDGSIDHDVMFQRGEPPASAQTMQIDTNALAQAAKNVSKQIIEKIFDGCEVCKFSPDQPRDDHGRWSADGGVGGTVGEALKQPGDAAAGHALGRASEIMAQHLLPGGYSTSPNAPNTFEDLVRSWDKTKHMTVYDGASDKTIFETPQQNYAFRAWHDRTHLRLMAPFTPQGEHAVAQAQIEDLKKAFGDTPTTARMGKMISAEIDGQVSYALVHHGEFPVDQRAFDLAYIKDPQAAVHATFKAFVSRMTGPHHGRLRDHDAGMNHELYQPSDLAKKIAMETQQKHEEILAGIRMPGMDSLNVGAADMRNPSYMHPDYTAKFNPNHVPAGTPDGGQFTSAGGGAVGVSGDTSPLSHHYVASQLINGVVHTDNVSDAARALAEGRRVQLNQPNETSTLLDHLGRVAQHMEKMGGNAPYFNLCNVSVKGTNLFCADNIGIPRVKMPQIDNMGAFTAYLKNKGYTVENADVQASHLRATQNELNGAKVGGMMRSLRAGTMQPQRLLVSSDNYVLDGHHRWAANVGMEYSQGSLSDKTTMPVSRVNIKIGDLLHESKLYGARTGAAATAKRFDVEIDKYSPDQARDWHGRFSTGGGMGMVAAAKMKDAWAQAGQFTHISHAIDASKRNQVTLAAAGHEIAAKYPGMEFKDPGPKSNVARIMEKAATRGPNGLTDLARAAFIVKTPEQADHAIADLKQKFPHGVIDEGWNRNLAHYMQRPALVRFKDGQIGEVQIMSHEFAQAKSGPDKGGGGGHDMYVKWRAATDPAVRENYANQMRSLYDGALQRSSAEWKAVAGRAVKLLKALLKAASSSIFPSMPTSASSTFCQPPLM